MGSWNLCARLGHILGEVASTVEGNIFCVVALTALEVIGGVASGHVESTAQLVVGVATERRGARAIPAGTETELCGRHELLRREGVWTVSMAKSEPSQRHK